MWIYVIALVFGGTAAGLLIALSAVVPQSVFNRWSDEIELEIQEANSEIVEFILTHH
jgi:biopolymer transport protein ExbB/TolQ